MKGLLDDLWPYAALKRYDGGGRGVRHVKRAGYGEGENAESSALAADIEGVSRIAEGEDAVPVITALTSAEGKHSGGYFWLDLEEIFVILVKENEGAGSAESLAKDERSWPISL